MKSQERARCLFQCAERVGQDTPTETQVADCINDALSDERTDVNMMLRSAGFGKAAEYLDRVWDRAHAGGNTIPTGD